MDFTGDSPSARFGHTITPIGKDRAILFGGAVGDTGSHIIIQESTSSLVIHFCAITTFAVGKNLTIMEHLQATVQHIILWQSIIFFLYLEEPLEAVS